MKIAVISDLHIGAEARSSDLQPNTVQSTHRAKESDFLDQFGKFVQKTGVRADYLIVPGDVSNTGNPLEFDKAHDVISFVRDALYVSPNNVALIPGNHDVDWSVLHDNPDHPVRRSQRYAGLKNEELCFANFFNASNGDLFTEPFFTIWETEDLFVLAYNSAWHDQPGADQHHGAAHLDHIEEMRTALDALQHDGSKVRLFLVHHHLEQLANLWPYGADYSVLENAVPLLQLLRDFSFDLLVHGHRHVPNFETISRGDNHRIVALCAGSFCRKIESELVFAVQNVFHLIDTDERDANTNLICGHVHSWSYSPTGGWQESFVIDNPNPRKRRGSGIEHVLPFGGYATPNELRVTLSGLIDSHFSNSGFIKWNDFIAIDKNLKFQSNTSINQALQQITNVRDFDYTHLKDGSPILLRRELDNG